MSTEKEKMEIAAKQYAEIPLDEDMEKEGMFWEHSMNLYYAFIAGYLYAKSLEKQND